MIDVLAEKLPDISRVVHYEDMVVDPAAALRTAADLCGRPMHDRPLPPTGGDRGCALHDRRIGADGVPRGRFD